MSSALSRALRLSLRQVSRLRLQQLTPQTTSLPPSAITASRSISTSSPNFEIIIVRNNEEFIQKVMNSDRSVIVNFHADWCEPCAILTPRLQEIIAPMENVDLAILNIEDHVELVEEFEVKAVPAVIAFRDGSVMGKFIGLVEADAIDNLIKQVDLPPLNTGGQTPLVHKEC